MPDKETHVIVGGGLAGAKAAEALREEGFEGRVVLVSSEAELPYERPPLSKEYLRGEAPREKARVHPYEFYEDHDVELRLGATISAIDTAAASVELHGGGEIGYDRLLLATGAEPRRLNTPGADLDGVLYLRDLSDSDAIRARLVAGSRLVVIGAGWIGAEVAASARQKGLEVTIVEMTATPLERVLGPEVGAIYGAVHRDHGVELLTGAGVEAFEGAGSVERVRLTGGRTIDCDFVVVGVGVEPRTQLAEGTGILVSNGILAGKGLETNVPGVFVAGDVANAFHPFYGGPLRVEHWANALNQPAVAARSMLGKHASYDRLPYFFSDQYEVGMEYTGYAVGRDEVVLRGDVERREFIAFWLRADCVVAGMNVGVWDVTDDIKALIRSRTPVARERLADPDVPLYELAADGMPAA
jgi:3-phenylpropionate/trans-cinnamate dioxygenase ferredoxin reductase component